MDVRQAEIVQQFHARDGFGHIQRCLQRLVGQAAARLVAQRARQPLARVDHAQDVVHAAAHHRKACVVGFLDAFEVVFKRRIHVQTHHITTRHHQRADLTVVQPEHIAHHGVLVRFDHARSGALHQHGVDLFFGHRAAAGFLHTHQAQQRARGGGQQQHKRLGGQRQKVDGPRHQAGKGLGVRLADALGHQFTHHDREIRDQHHHQAGGRVAAKRHGNAQCFKPQRQGPSQGGLTHDTVQHANRCDADLDGGEKTRGVFAQLHGSGGAAIALINQLLQPGFAGRDQSDLGHGKQAVEKDEGEEYCYFHTKGALRALGC
ncbi:hypothetical protein D3C71_1421820 [compost metagenome]